MKGPRSPNAVTRLDLSCRLSILEAYGILFELTNVEDVKFGDLSSEDPNLAGTIPHASIKHLLLLTSLSITSYVDLHPLFLALAMPKLKHLEWTEGPKTDKSVLDPSVQVPWHQLEGLVIHYGAEETCNLAAILVQCSQLERLTLSSAKDNKLQISFWDQVWKSCYPHRHWPRCFH